MSLLAPPIKQHACHPKQCVTLSCYTACSVRHRAPGRCLTVWTCGCLMSGLRHRWGADGRRQQGHSSSAVFQQKTARCSHSQSFVTVPLITATQSSVALDLLGSPALLGAANHAGRLHARAHLSQEGVQGSRAWLQRGCAWRRACSTECVALAPHVQPQGCRHRGKPAVVTPHPALLLSDADYVWLAFSAHQLVMPRVG
jgi:hypothetical protein